MLTARRRKSAIILCLCALCLILSQLAFADGFNANRVNLSRLPNGLYRVTIWYTHVEVGEFRVAQVDFEKKTDALKAYEDLRTGADFYLGNVKESIHFHKPPLKNNPY